MPHENVHNKTPMTGVERTFHKDEFLVSKTDLKGHVTYANRIFLGLAGYEEKELIGRPHNLIRHPDMPRCVYKLLWDTIKGGNEIFAYVVNKSRNGDHYWVFAHVTPSFDAHGQITGYHSNRRIPERNVIEEVITPLYRDLVAEELKHSNAKEGMNRAGAMLAALLEEKGTTYEELVFSLKGTAA